MDKQPIFAHILVAIRQGRHARTLPVALLLGLIPILLSGCGSSFGPASAAPTATATRAYVTVPTFTPTTAVAPAPTVAPTLEPTVAVAAPPTTAPITQTVAQTATLVTTPTASAARLTVSGDLINIRSGPGTEFETIGTAAQGESFALQARNAQGDWWQICCVNEQPGWIFGQLATVEGADTLAIAADIPPQPTPAAVAAATVAATPIPVAEAPTPAPVEPTSEPTVPAPLPPVATDSSAGDFNPDAQYQIVHFRVLGLNENNGGVRDSQSQHHIFLTVLDQAGNGVDGAVVENLVGEKGQIITGSKGPGKAEITMYYEPFKLRVASDGTGPVTSQTSNQMGLAFPHLPDLVGKLGDETYEYGVCPTLEIKCTWPIQGIHFSYEITFQKVK